MADDETTETYDPERCSACRGSGKVISGLGGTPHEIDCPWCDGAGRFIAEHDAQARWRREGPDGDPPEAA